MDTERIIREGIDLYSEDIFYEVDAILYNGVLYTGIGYELYGNGNLKSLSYYKDGYEYGVTKRWYIDGTLKEEEEMLHGQKNGKNTIWHQNGKVNSIAMYEYGIELEYQEWDEDGNLLAQRVMDEKDPSSLYNALVKLRDINKGRYDEDLQFVLEKTKDLFCEE